MILINATKNRLIAENDDYKIIADVISFDSIVPNDKIQ